MKLLPLVAFAPLLASCVTDRTVYAPDGRPAHLISCDGAVQTMGACLAKAGDICGSSGYDVIPGSASEDTVWVLGNPAINRHMMIACKGR